jgi:hypothetical protein
MQILLAWAIVLGTLGLMTAVYAAILLIVEGRRGKRNWEEEEKDYHLDHFGRLNRVDVQKLVEAGELDCPTPRATKRLNDECILNLGKGTKT